MPLRALDSRFLSFAARPELSGLRRGTVEFWYLGIKQARAERVRLPGP